MNIYLSSDYLDTYLHNLLAFKHGMLSVYDYTEKFNDLIFHRKLEEAGCMSASRYWAGLRHEV